MKKIIISTVLFLMMFSVSAYAGLYNRFTGTCIVEGCDCTTCDHSYYCSSHKCSVSHCRDRRSSSGSGLYCFGHKYKDRKAEKKTVSRRNYSSRSKSFATELCEDEMGRHWKQAGGSMPEGHFPIR